MKVNAVEHHEYQSREQVETLTRDASPFVLNNAISNWPCFHKWNFEYLTANASELKVSLFTMPYLEEPRLHHDHDSVKLIPGVNLTKFFERMFSDSPCDTCWQLGLTAVNDLGTLGYDTPQPEWLPSKTYLRSVWFGTKGYTTSAHYDCQKGFLAQISGRKLINLVSPAYWKNLEIMPMFDVRRNFFKANLNVIHRNDIEITRLVLEPKQVLYIPPGWVHQVDYLDHSMSLNMWLQMGLEMKLSWKNIRYSAREIVPQMLHPLGNQVARMLNL